MAKKSTQTELVALRLPPALIKRIDKWAKKAGRTNRSEAIRALIDSALNFEDEGPPAPDWLLKLEELAAKMNTDVDGAVQVLAEYVTTPEPAPAETDAQAKPKRGRTLRSLF